MSTSLMGLQTSTPGVTNDLTAATNIESNWTTIDTHDHSSGKGAQVPSAGLNINANLSFAGYKPYNLLATQFSNQGSSLSTASNKPCVYVLNGELRFIDNSGNDVQITNSGSVAGASGSISGLSAPVAAGFSSATFSWQANSGTGLYAKMSNADINLYEATAGVSNAVTLKSPASLAASYSVLFPAATPASTSYVTMANSGQLATASADSIASAMTTTGANAIATTMNATGADTIAATMTSTGANAIATDRTRAVTTNGTDPGAGGVVFSSSSGSFTTTSSTLVDVTNLSITITTSGRPVYVGMTSATTSTGTADNGALETTGTGFVMFAILRAGASIAVFGLGPTNQMSVPAGTVNFVDNPAAGTYTYKIQALSFGGVATARVNFCKLVAYEL